MQREEWKQVTFDERVRAEETEMEWQGRSVGLPPCSTSWRRPKPLSGIGRLVLV